VLRARRLLRLREGRKVRHLHGAGERVLLPAVRAADDQTLVIADGFSCREQIAHGTDRRALHLAEVLQLARHQGEVDQGLRPEVQHARLAPRELTAPTSPAPSLMALAGGLIAGGATAWYVARR